MTEPEIATTKKPPTFVTSALALALALSCTAVAYADQEDLLTRAARVIAEGRVDAGLGTLEELFSYEFETPADVLADARFAPLREDAEGRAALRQLLRGHVRETRIVMVPPGEAGEPMLIRGRVVRTADGTGVPGATVELYHTDATGNYEPNGRVGDGANPRLFGFVRTDEEGRFEARTIKPAPYPGSSVRAAHVHFRIQAEGYRSLTDEFRPYDDPADAERHAAALEQGRRVSKVHREDDLWVCEVTIPMRPRRGG